MAIPSWTEWSKGKIIVGASGSNAAELMAEYNRLYVDGQGSSGDSSTSDSTPAPEPSTPSTPSAEDVSKNQLAQSQAAPTDGEGSARSGRERASKKRKGAAAGKRGLSSGVRRKASSGLSI